MRSFEGALARSFGSSFEARTFKTVLAPRVVPNVPNVPNPSLSHSQDHQNHLQDLQNHQNYTPPDGARGVLGVALVVLGVILVVPPKISPAAAGGGARNQHSFEGALKKL